MFTKAFVSSETLLLSLNYKAIEVLIHLIEVYTHYVEMWLELMELYIHFGPLRFGEGYPLNYGILHLADTISICVNFRLTFFLIE